VEGGLRHSAGKCCGVPVLVLQYKHVTASHVSRDVLDTRLHTKSAALQGRERRNRATPMPALLLERLLVSMGVGQNLSVYCTFRC
jgi:hypothetical protein